MCGFEMEDLLTRRKSGEIAKPALRSSLSSSTLSKKAVHFDNNNLEQIRHFHLVDRPISINSDSSPIKIDNDQSKPGAEWEVIATNFPKNPEEGRHPLVRVKHIHLSKDYQRLLGIITVANVAFEKHVTARFTFDYWQTISEITAGYTQNDPPIDGHDQFQFSIKLSDQANLQSKTLLLCVRYRVNGQEYWDNNSGKNFRVNFIQKIPDLSHTSRLSDRYNFGVSQHSRLESNCGPTTVIPERSQPDLNSAEYKALIQTFCYFRSGSGADQSNEEPPHPSWYESIISMQLSAMAQFYFGQWPTSAEISNSRAQGNLAPLLAL